MKRILGIPADELWKCENGEPLDPDALYPVVDVVNRRLFGIRKDNKEDAVVIQSYHPTAQKNGAFDFARFIWGPPDKWERPDISNRIVSCLGAPACTECIAYQLPMTTDLAQNWRIQSLDNNQLMAGRLVDPSDPNFDVITNEHVLANVDNQVEPEKIQKELMRRCIGLFGEPCDMADGIIAPSYMHMYRIDRLA